MIKVAVPVSPKRDHFRGPTDAPVVLLEYGDYECPFCGQAHLAVKAVEQAARGMMAFVFRNFPLATIHPHAERAAEAAEAAGAQGRFWEMHDLLYENQDALDDDSLLAYALALGLDVPRFARELAEQRYAARVREDFMSGVRSGVNGTPTFFINGVRHDGPWTAPELLAAVRAAATEKVR
jgi:protein-disulfide isomerase